MNTLDEKETKSNIVFYILNNGHLKHVVLLC